MILHEQAIKKNVDLSDEFLLNKNYKKAIWKFYVSYNIALNINQDIPLLAKKKNRLWKKVLMSKEGITSKKYSKLQALINQDIGVIAKALKVLYEKSESFLDQFGDIYTEGTIGVLAYESPYVE